MNGCKQSIRNKIQPKIAEKYESFRDEEKTGKLVDRMEKAREAHLVGAALIATVTFAAGFTFPGGYNDDIPHKGMAVLAKKAAFRAFIICDTIAFVLSICAVYVHLGMAMRLKSARKFVRLFKWALNCTTFAMRAMVIAFATGAYAALEDYTTLASFCVIISIFFFIFFSEVNRYKRPKYVKN